MRVKQLHGKGNHLILDAYTGEKLDSVDFVKEFLLKSVDRIGMRAISEPLVIYHKAKDNSESGVTGVIILAESNITIHTYPNKKWFCLDIYSCNEFDIEKTVTYLIKELDISKYKLKILKRGTN